MWVPDEREMLLERVRDAGEVRPVRVPVADVAQQAGEVRPGERAQDLVDGGVARDRRGSWRRRGRRGRWGRGRCNAMNASGMWEEVEQEKRQWLRSERERELTGAACVYLSSIWSELD